MKELIKKFAGPKEIAAIKSYLRALLASAITMGIALLTDLKPEYAIIIGALAAPLAKWADKNEKEYGIGSN
jgi:hypothetical protein